MKKILAIIIVCLGLLALVPNVECDETESGTIMQKYTRYTNPMVIIDNTSDTGDMIISATDEICNLTATQKRLIIDIGAWNISTPEVTNITLHIQVTTLNAGNISIYRLDGNNGHYMILSQANWTSYKSGSSWTSPGADYNATALDTQYVDSNTEVIFNITSYFKLTQGIQKGLIAISDTDSQFQLSGWVFYEFHYISGSGKSTDLKKDIWNLKGYIGASAKNASTIYSEISNCKAISGKNSTGYWYTYAPTWGIIENWDLVFGDGLFIVTTANTTWDHT